MSVATINHTFSDFYAVPASLSPAARLLPLIDLLGGKCWVAGGALRDTLSGQQSKDTDIFFANDTDFCEARTKLINSGEVRKVLLDVASVWRAETERGQLDLVRRYFADPMRTVRAFDFVACCAALSSTHFVYHRDFAADARTRILRLNAIPAPKSSGRRAARLIEKGWTMATTEREALFKLIVESGDTSGDDYQVQGWMS